MPTSPTDFTDRTVVVTGASSGIGRAVARAFGEAGATVINADLREEPKDEGESTPTHEAVREAGGTAEYVETDASDPDQLAAVVEAARDYGGLDVMVNNAAMQLPKRMFDVERDELERILSVNVGSVYFGTKVAAREFVDRDHEGVVVNTASISSNLAQAGQVQYDATKGAVRMITRGAALELAEHGVRVNAVAPGQIATEFVEGWTAEATEKGAEGGLAKPIPLGRAGTPEDCAGAYLYLASDAASYVTGELLHVDGGWQVY
ncbi:SDR family NAD(P)-dependent oxidoreductase [Halobium salinum]|uniref:SDR family NAD(P)-dependent oxidoreductase n=1 Tax=Halobium salinum TaxID=1364940 RepID=A0ABD5PH94_9EURY|nr:SDR family oxidoreductase [Halobium salinum]